MKRIKTNVGLLLLCCFMFGYIKISFARTGNADGAGSVTIVINKSAPMEVFGASKIEAALQKLNIVTQVVDKATASGKEQVQVKMVSPASNSEIKKEGYRINKSGQSYIVSAIDESGAMYGLMDVAEQIEMQKGMTKITNKVTNPRFVFRAVKYNLPWHSYRENESIQVNGELSKDLNMWRAFLDMMAEDRLNVLTLWGLHPFPYMIKAKNFPKATPFSDAELVEWKTFWTALFKMAKERGIETYMINWNIIVSKSFVENYGEGNAGLWADGKSSPQIEKYTSESVTQVINEYPDLTGLGITLGEAMQKWEGEQMTEWVDKTIIKGIKAADRKIKFIYRAALSGNHQPHRDLIDSSGLDTPENPIMVELKFNWSHGHSSTTLVKAHGGGTGSQYWTNPAPTHHKMAWMIRNEDFFRLRWAEPDFIREHIKVNGQDYVGGYFIGSECLIPAKDIYHTSNHPHINWKYEFEKQWLYYQQWGRLLYDPTTSDAVFANAFNQRFAGNTGAKMVDAYKLSTRTTQRIGQFFDFTWDHSLYIEGFIGKKRTFIKLDEVIDSKPLEPNFVGIKEYGDGSKNFGTKVTPLQLAASLEKDNLQALNMVKSIATTNATLQCEMEDVKAWAHLGLYFAAKIRAGVAVNQHNSAKAVDYITAAQQHWRNLVAVTEPHIQSSYLAITENKFQWKDFQPAVDAEIDWVKNNK